ncbi:MAG: AAA family ATPase, partial [Chloroflexota bacterium]
RLQYHAAFWDEWQRLPLFGLDQHIVAVAERDPAAAQAAIEYLSTHRQRWAAQAAQIELDARQLERCADANAIAAAQRTLGAGELTGPASALLRSFARISQDVDAALRQESAYNQRLALRAVEDRLDALLRELTRSAERYAVRFRPIATQWRETIAAHERVVAVTAEQRQEIDNPYVIGVPLTAQQEIFVGRANISARIEQLLLDRRRPALLLYGQRRMGKTSLLNNLGRLLPTTIAPLFVDLQGPASWASDHAGLLYNLARGMCDSAQRQRGLVLPALARDALQSDPFTSFDVWLDDVERSLGDSAALLALDEFETLDAAFDEKRFSEGAVLGMVRHIIQHRARFKVLLAGSHTLDEAQRWASYLINAQTVHIGYLTADEARTLVVQPVKDFTLRYEPDAVERVLRLTRGHPFLAQLLCAEIVARKNEQAPSERRLARLADVEAAIPDALNSGSFFFADVERNQADEAEAKLLRWLAARGEGEQIARDDVRQWAPDAADAERALRHLVRRELLERVNGGYRFQVELVRRWFARADMETR